MQSATATITCTCTSQLDFLPTLVAVIALIVSIVTWYQSYVQSQENLHKSLRNNYMQGMLAIDHELIQKPHLWNIYDEVARRNQNSTDGELKAFAWMHINLFEIVYSDLFEKQSKLISWQNKSSREAWNTYIRAFLQQSELAQSIVKDPEAMKLLKADFAAYLRNLLPKD